MGQKSRQMGLKKAVKLAVECVRTRIQMIAWDANMFELGVSYPLAERRAKEKQELLEAIAVLQSTCDRAPAKNGQADTVTELPEGIKKTSQ